MRRRILRIAVLALGVLVGLGITLFLVARYMGSGTIQEWIGSQLQEIANAYLNPHLSFTDLSYEYPLTVSLKNMHLTADDPAHPGHTIDIIACDKAEISLAEIPQIGKPIVIEKISLNEPLISAVAVEPKSKKFVGFSNLIRGGVSSGSDENGSSAPKKLSDVFRMRLVQISDGKVVYDPRIEGTVPMTLDKINTLLNIEPSEPGWYKIDTDIARQPVFDFGIKGQLNLDTFSVKDVDINIMADLGRDKLDYLPPEIQSLLKQYDAKGKLNIEFTGNMPVMDPMSGQVQAKVTLDSANLALSGLVIPVDNLSLEARFEDHKVYLPLLRVSALGGTADLSGAVDLNKRLDSVLRVNVASMQPAKLSTNSAVAAAADDRLDLDLSIATSLMSLFGKAPPPQRTALASINLHNFRVSAVDPVHPATRLDLVACKKLDVNLTQPIISGKPIIIDGIDLDTPVISAVAIAPGSPQFVGVPTFAAPPAQAAAAPDQSTAAAATNPSPAAAKPRIASIGEVKTFKLANAKIIYDPRLAHTQRMVLDQINFALNVDPNDPGSYQLSTKIDRSPNFLLSVNGKVNIDNPGVQDLAFELAADLSQENLEFLPPQLQLILKHFNAREKLDLHGSATVAMADPQSASAQVNVDVQNIDLSPAGLNVPVKDFALSAHLQHRTLAETIKIEALNNEFNIKSSTTLGPRLDTDVTLDLNDVILEPLLASLLPDRPALSSATMLNAQLELQSPLMVALGAVAGNPNEPAASLTVRKLRLTAENPIDSKPLDFFACDSIGATLASLPAPGKPIQIGSIGITSPKIRAIALVPASNQFAGFTALQNMTAGQPAPAAAATPAAPPAEKTRLSDVFRMQTLSLADASIYYDPRIDATTPMSFDHVEAKINLDSQSGDFYRFDALVPSNPDLNLAVAGRADIDNLKINLSKLDLTTRIGQDSPDYKYLPPQVQVILPTYDPVAAIHVTATGTVPLTKPLDADVTANIAIDKLKFTAGGYRLPVDMVRLPVHYTPGQVEFLDPTDTAMGGPTFTAFDGVAELTGPIQLDDRLDSTISLKVDGMKLQTFLADKIVEPKKTDLIATIRKLDLELVDAPVLQILAEATPAPATEPSVPTTQPDMQAVTQGGSPKYMTDLPASWGSCDLEITDARLAGLEVLQGVTNLAKTAFTDLFDKKDKDQKRVVVPKESAIIICNFEKDRLDLTKIHYEGEALAADGKGYVTLEQQLDLYLTGGVFQKLGGFIKQISDSLLYYHVYGTFSHIQYDVHRGDGKPIVEGVKKGAAIAESGIKTGFKDAGVGLNKAGSFIHGLFNKKSSNQGSSTQPSNQN